ncbi:ABC transporter substrate-binding protein [Paenibacillus sp. ACRRX]|uniref:ABC transporter substrate-binding protein n=1 Tax=Paenibacillus sp. ACRRX TaxID=2918206 RepID=UPI001EF600A1|nr:ABC transporter substrate-binding protein [Paenibacillus sp. ACRRX]MCG7410700.1 ABC transporter substrate-binding protein [Paenibacillus sp. ACRRX]
MLTSATTNTRLSAAAHCFYMPIRVEKLNAISLCGNQDEVQHDACMIIVWGGTGTLCVNGHEHQMSRGSVFLGDAAPQPHLYWQPGATLRGIVIEYCCISNDASGTRGLDHSVPIHRCPAAIMRLAGELEIIWREPQLGGPFRLQQIFTELLTELHKELTSRQEPSNSWIEQALCYMEAHYREELTREQMADRSDVSPEHFSRMFRKYTGRTFNAYLTLLRIRSAQRQLLTGISNLHVLAQEVGYKEGAYLSRKFKESVGLSPTHYQRKKKRIAALNLNHTASLLALGITPEIGVYTPWLERRQNTPGKIQMLDPYVSTPAAYYEAVASSHPDVIISYNTAVENKSLLPLAPVVELPFMTMSWRDQFRLLADIVERREHAEEWLLRYDDLVSSINEQLDRQLGDRGTAIVWEVCQNAAYCFSSSYGRGCQILYDDLGFRMPEQLMEEGIASKGFVEATIEAIANYPADYIFITDLPSCADGQQQIHKLFESARWKVLEAVQQKQVYILNDAELFYGYDPLSSLAQLHELVQVLGGTHHNNTK